MANFTARAIKASFIKLLNERPLSKISVRDIVEDCGINRNSFYYHFQDIPALIEEIITEQTETIIREHPTIDAFPSPVPALWRTSAPYTIFIIPSSVICLKKSCSASVNMR